MKNTTNLCFITMEENGFGRYKLRFDFFACGNEKYLLNLFQVCRAK